MLAAATLLLTAIGIVYGTWYAMFVETLAKDIAAHKPDRIAVQRDLREAFWRRALPLAFFSAATSIILAPPSWRQIADSANAYLHRKATLLAYDPLVTLDVPVELFLLAFSLHLIAVAWALGARLRKANRH